MSSSRKVQFKSQEYKTVSEEIKHHVLACNYNTLGKVYFKMTFCVTSVALGEPK